MRHLSGLSEQLDSEAGDRLAHAICRRPESGKTSALSGMQFVLERGKRGSFENSGEGLDKAVNRRDGDGVACDARVMEKGCDKRGREQGKIDGQKDGEARESSGQSGADAGQRAKAGVRVIDDGRIRGERGASGRGGSGD